MANGVLGAWDLLPGVPQAIYVCNNDQATVLTLNFVNRSNVPADVRVSIGTGGSVQNAAEFLEFDTQVEPKGVLERTGLIVGPGMYLVVTSDAPDSNANCWGVEVGTQLTSANITQNTGTAPTWVTAAGSLGTITVGTNEIESLQLSATHPNRSTLQYSVTSGSLPAGMFLQSDGLLVNSGTTTYTSGTTGQTTNFDITASNGTNTSVRSFSITKKWYDGSSSTLAAKDAVSLKLHTGLTTNGNYWINLPTVGPTLVYCDLSTDNGAWMRLAYAGSVSGVGNSNHIVFHQFGNVGFSRSYGDVSFSRFDLARLMGASANSRLMWRRSTDNNVILIHNMGELCNRIPGAIRAGNMDMNGTGAGFPISEMKMSITGPTGLVSRAVGTGRYENGPSYPGIAWNSTYNNNSDNVGSFTTFLNRRSIIYWETNGPQSNGQWFHGDPLQLGPARGPTFGQGKLDIEVYFMPY
jgi:hypothetical protein